MSLKEFQCPSCSTRLRMRDRNQLQRVIPCPDCGEKLKLEPDGPDNVIAVAQSPVRENVSKKTDGYQRFLNPRTVSMIVAALIIMTLGFIVFGPSGSDSESSQLTDTKGAVDNTQMLESDVSDCPNGLKSSCQAKSFLSPANEI